MSKTSYALIFVMLITVAYMGAFRGYEWYQRRVKLYNEQHPAPSIFAPEPDTLPAPAAVEAWRPAKEDIFLEEKPLDEVLQEQQAKETIESILNDYRMNPAFRRFNEQLEQVTNGKIKDFGALSTQSLAQIFQEHPQILQIVRENETKEDFMRVLQEIFSNPQYQKSVQKLQGGTVPAAVKAPARKDE